MPDLLKSQFLLSRAEGVFQDEVWNNDTVPYAYRDEDTGQILCFLLFPGVAFLDMGQPDEITVTVEPGDTLNEYDPGTDEHRAGRPSPP